MAKEKSKLESAIIALMKENINLRGKIQDGKIGVDKLQAINKGLQKKINSLKFSIKLLQMEKGGKQYVK